MRIDWGSLDFDAILQECGKDASSLDELAANVGKKLKAIISKDRLWAAHRRNQPKLGLKDSLVEYLQKVKPSTVEKSQRLPKLDDLTFPLDKGMKKDIKSAKRIIITSAMNNSPLDEKLWSSLQNYATHIGAAIIVIPTRYRNPSSPLENTVRERLYWWPEEVEDYLTDDLVKIHKHLWVMGDVKINATSVFPLRGLDALTKGHSAVFGHGQQAMEMVATPQHKLPQVLYTTGSVSEPTYSNTKSGIKGEFYHTKGAVIIELDGTRFHIRNLLADAGGGFYDLEWYWGPEGKSRTGRIEALVTGDEHAMFNDRACREATYLNKDSICAVLKPKVIARHDVFDAYSISHHNRKDPVIQYSKHQRQHHKVEDELELTAKHIDSTTPKDSENWIVSSNHHDHLLRWMKEVNAPTQEPWNAKVWLDLWQELIETVDFKEHGVVHADPLALWMSKRLKAKTKWLDVNDTAQVKGIALGMHGHIGINGSRGSANQFAKLGIKTVLGHRHAPCIKKGVFQAGTSTPLRLEYTKGPSSWANAHVAIYPNGKRQMIFIVKGAWRAPSRG